MPDHAFKGGGGPVELTDDALDTVQGAGKSVPKVKSVVLSSESAEPSKRVVLSSESEEPSKRIIAASGSGSI